MHTPDMLILRAEVEPLMTEAFCLLSWVKQLQLTRVPKLNEFKARLTIKNIQFTLLRSGAVVIMQSSSGH